MTRAITSIHLTDLHIGSPDISDSHLFSDTNATLATILDMISAISPKPSFIVASGDLTNKGDVRSFNELRRIIAATDVPVVYALGNHDTRPGFYQGMLDRTEALETRYFHDRVIDGIHVITLDSSTPGQTGGTIEPEQFAWLEKVLDTHPERPKPIVSHHPPALRE